MWIYSSGFPKSQDVGRQLHKKEHGKPDKQRFDPAIMIKVDGDRYRHPDTNKVYRALPDINGDRLAVAHEGEKYGTVYEEVIVVDNEWSGWGSALKPAHEPIALARKPIKLSIAKNAQKWGTGAINIDATRIPYVDDKDIKSAQFGRPSTDNHSYINTEAQQTRDNLDVVQANDKGRFPSNVIGEILQADYH
jgi:site-specific DNA-methyltransferase (adenine-specific)